MNAKWISLPALLLTAMLGCQGPKSSVPGSPALASTSTNVNTATKPPAPTSAAPAGEKLTVSQLVIHADQGKTTISKNIYGHFSEHLGHCIYDGIWVGEDSPMPNTRGIRNDVVEALKRSR